MAPKHEHKGSLSQAHDKIAGLMDELETTLELVKRLSDSGEDEAALRLIDRQRSELYQVVGSLSTDVGVGPRSWWEPVKRHASVVVAATLAAVSTLAVSVAALDRNDPVRDLTTQISRAEDIADPAVRLTRIITVYRVERPRLGPEQAAAVADDVIAAIERAKEDLPADDADSKDLIAQAERASRDIQDGRAPDPPNPPSTDEPPVPPLEGILPD